MESSSKPEGLCSLPTRAICTFSFRGSSILASQRLVRVWERGEPQPLTSDAVSQYRLAKDAVQALSEAHGIEYIYGSISSTLCE